MAVNFDQNYTYHSKKIVKALEYAARAHEGQTRRNSLPYNQGKETPYFSHTAGVGLILGRAGCPEDIIAAGILHDVIEDTSANYEDLVEEFGKEVSDLVMHVTIPDGLGLDEGKEVYAQNLAKAPKEAAWISAADLLYNRSSVLMSLEHGKNPWGKFPWLPKKLLDQDRQRIAVIKDKLGDHQLVKDLELQHRMLRDHFNA